MVIVLVLGIGLLQAPNDMVVHIPPDLRSGAAIGGTDVHPANVYAFGFYIYQQLNRWPNDGSKDYANAIYSLGAYLTPSYQATLVSEMELTAKRGELTNRERQVSEIFGQSYAENRVDLLGNGVWHVWLDVTISESVQGVNVKEKHLRIPLRVVRSSGDMELNPWQLALDGFAPGGATPLSVSPEGEVSVSGANAL